LDVFLNKLIDPGKQTKQIFVLCF